MKCKHCGTYISPEDGRCPNCGAVNEAAQKHRQEMKKYNEDYMTTKKGVYQKTKQLSKNAVWKVIIGLIGIAVITYILLASNKENIFISLEKMSLNKSEVVSYIEECVNQGKYQDLEKYCESNHIYEESGKYASYFPVMHATMNYNFVTSSVNLFLRLQEQDEKDLDLTSEFILSFYRDLNLDEFSYIEGADNDENQKMLDQVKEDMDQYLVEQLHLQEEDLQEISDMTKANLNRLLAERYFTYEEN